MDRYDLVARTGLMSSIDHSQILTHPRYQLLTGRAGWDKISSWLTLLEELEPKCPGVVLIVVTSLCA